MQTCCVHTIQQGAGCENHEYYIPLHTLQPWYNAALYEWATVGKKSGMAPPAACNTVLRYQRPPVSLSCGFLRASPQLQQQSMHPVPPGRQTLYSQMKVPISRSVQALQNPSDIPPKRASSLTTAAETKQVFRLSRNSIPTCAISGPKWRRRGGVPYMSSVQYNGTLWSVIMRTIPIEEAQRPFTFLAMRQCGDTPVSPHWLGIGIIIRDAINHKLCLLFYKRVTFSMSFRCKYSKKLYFYPHT